MLVCCSEHSLGFEKLCVCLLGPYDLRDAENTDGIMESSH